MVQKVEAAEDFDAEHDMKAMETLLKAVGIMGGPRELVEYKRLTWLPALMESIYVVILSEESDSSEEKIADDLGITRQTVKTILDAEMEGVAENITGIDPGERADSERYHIAGGLAKLAYRELEE